MSVNGKEFRPLNMNKGKIDQEDNSTKSSLLFSLTDWIYCNTYQQRTGWNFWILREYDCPTARAELLILKIGYSYETKFHLCDNSKRHDVGV